MNKPHHFLLKSYPAKIDATFNYISQKKLNEEIYFNESCFSITLMKDEGHVTILYCSTMELIDYKTTPHLRDAIMDENTVIEYDNVLIDLDRLYQLIEERKLKHDYHHYKIQSDLAIQEIFSSTK